MKEFLIWIGLDLKVLLAGFFGALLLLRKQKKTKIENILTLLTGSFSAGYIAPFLAQLMNVEHPDILTFIGFVVGYGGIQVMDKIIAKFTEKHL